MDERGNSTYTEWLKRQESLTYLFNRDLNKMDDPFDSNLRVTGTYPSLLELYYNGEINLETITIIANMTGCIPYWSKKIQEPIIFPKTKLILEKYHPFIMYDKSKIKKLILSHFDS